MTDDWFAVEKIDRDTFAISEYKHWEETHCYLLCGRDRALLIDTGLGVANVKEVTDSLTRLPVTVVTTHAHWDHIGGHGYYALIAVHEKERDWLEKQFPLPLEAVKHNLLSRPCEFPEGFSADTYRIYRGAPSFVFGAGDSFDLGGRRLTAIHTPGHSPGHCCFYEKERGYLFSGDLIYLGCLDAFYPTTDPRQFYESIKKVRGLDIDRILPGHHSLSVPVTLAAEIEKAFCELEQQGNLEQGKGLFDFGSFQIHI